MAITIKTNVALAPSTVTALVDGQVLFHQGDEFDQVERLMDLKYSARLNDSHRWPNRHLVSCSMGRKWAKVAAPETLHPTYRGWARTYRLPFGGVLNIWTEGEWAYKATHPADVVVSEAILEGLQVPLDLGERNEKLFQALPGLVSAARMAYSLARGYQTPELSRAQLALSNL